MAEGFEPYHVPQQSRRDKLRVVAQTNHPGCADHHLQGCAGLLPLYDPSLLPSYLLTCAKPSTNQTSPCKEEGQSLMGYVTNVSSSTSQNPYMDLPQSSLQINPSSIQDINSNPFLFNPQNLRVFDHEQSFNGGGEVVVYKPEPLSLSLSSQTHQTSLPLELNLQSYEVAGGGYLVPGIVGSGSVSNDLSRSSVPLGPFTGYASILKGSRFLKPAQQLLEELCDVGRGIYTEKVSVDPGLMDPDHPLETLGGGGVSDESPGGGERRRRKSRLISMLDEVYRRYKYYYQQMQTVVASFESVAGLSNAAPYANLALNAMSKHFRNLKNAITDQLQFTSQAQNYRKEETPRLGSSDIPYSQRPVQNSGFLEHQPVWRPQRGLPERAVTVLRGWLFEHFLHPYPTDTDKLMLAKQTGLSRSQVSNWFINARVRLWKPMVEEIHQLETRQAQKAAQRGEELHAERPNNNVPMATSLASDNPSASTKEAQDLPSKRTRNEFTNISSGAGEPVNLSYENLPNHQIGAGGGNGGVSLTLGLHQNNVISLSEPFPINAARRFGLDTSGDGYVMGGFETATNRQFGRDIIGGQLLRDFVG
ncbi:hypothetical protein NMG60_11000299 [Bertholletia excelsa]